MHKNVKCIKCGGEIPNYSIHFSNLPDSEKCRCQKPEYPTLLSIELCGGIFSKFLEEVGRILQNVK